VTRFFLTVTLTFLALFLSRAYGDGPLSEETVRCDPFGSLAVWRPEASPKGVVFLLSGSSGWGPDVAEIARSVAKLDYLVAGIDVPGYLRHAEKSPGPCVDLVTDLRELQGFLSERFSFPTQRSPILVGCDTGGALAYAALEQDENHFFHAVISLDFCPELPLRKPLCRERVPAESKTPIRDRLVLQPAEQVQTAWFALQAEPACDGETALRFIRQVDGSRLVAVPRTVDENSSQKGWMPLLLGLLQWLDPRISGQVRVETDVKGVPLTEVKVPVGVPETGRMAVMLSGDGGWAALDRGVAAELARRGIPTVGWDSLSYFWKPRTPDEAGMDLERVLQHYTNVWQKEEVLLIGYSFGADVLAFMANRLSPEMRTRVKLVVFLGLGPGASFTFHLTDWIGGVAAGGLPVVPEVEGLTWVPRICIYGDREQDSTCPSLAGGGVQVLGIPGDHHFEDDYRGIVNRVMGALTR
jgi:type IV secretory pathway VirJ component